MGVKKSRCLRDVIYERPLRDLYLRGYTAKHRLDSKPGLDLPLILKPYNHISSTKTFIMEIKCRISNFIVKSYVPYIEHFQTKLI